MRMPCHNKHRSAQTKLLPFGVKRSLTDDLLAWFGESKRDLPWRKARNPYRVWISEAMLQQTQVATVIPYFGRWLKRFPDVNALASASLDDVLKQWEGLGYYRRARNVHEAANVVINKRNGAFPETYDGWLELPGVGPYTAAAISSIVNGEGVVAVDGNVKRVAARLFRLDVPEEKDVRKRLTPYIPEAKPGDFNEALMELGATVCTKNPTCLFCPIQAHCQAFAAGQVAAFPKPKEKPKRPHYKRYALVELKDDALWLRQRGEDEMLSGLWGFVLAEQKPKRAKLLPSVKHAYTHFSQAVTPVLAQAPKDSGGKFVEVAELDSLALSTLDRKILQTLKEKKVIDF